MPLARKINKPVVAEIEYSTTGLVDLVTQYSEENSARLLLNYPTVYVVHDHAEEEYLVYVGETGDIRHRTKQHLVSDPKHRDDWQQFAQSDSSRMFVIGHENFNKSLTLDVENRLMLYLTGAPRIKALYNRKSNPQNDYYTQEYFDSVFQKIWQELRTHNRELFPAEELIKDSALFKASPFHKLTRQQLDAKTEIIEKIYRALQADDAGALATTNGKLIMVRGEAGAGKTVLLSSIFYELFQSPSDSDEDVFSFQSLNTYLLVNNNDHQKVYAQIARKLGLINKNDDRVSKPTRFINNVSPDAPVDVVLIDEAHLLWTQGNQGYRGKNQLLDILNRAKVVVAIFDSKQIMATNQYWEDHTKEILESHVVSDITLTNQMRMDASETTVDWVRSIVDEGIIKELHLESGFRDEENYEVRVFDHPLEMRDAIHRQSDSEVERGLSRMLATFDWPYSSADKRTFNVEIGDDFSMPWNGEIAMKTGRLSAAEKRSNSTKSWVEQDHTIDEVGSTFTIQGFDLNYAGVILGESVKYRDGKIVFDPSASKNKNATHKRTLADKSRIHLGEQLLRNELNVLLTRGVNGLYIYAVDEELRLALKEHIKIG